LPTWASTAKSRHIRFCTAFIEKNETRQIDPDYFLFPLPTLLLNIGAVLFAGF